MLVNQVKVDGIYAVNICVALLCSQGVAKYIQYVVGVACRLVCSVLLFVFFRFHGLLFPKTWMKLRDFHSMGLEQPTPLGRLA